MNMTCVLRLDMTAMEFKHTPIEALCDKLEI